MFSIALIAAIKFIAGSTFLLVGICTIIDESSSDYRGLYPEILPMLAYSALGIGLIYVGLRMMGFGVV